MDIPALLRGQLGLTDPELLKAAVTGLFQMTAVAITGFVAIFTWWRTQKAQRVRDAALRNEKVADIQTALWAEIVGNHDQFGSFDLDRHANEAVARFAADAKYTPFVPRDPGTQVFDAVLENVHVLPEDVIAPVIGYYRQVRAVDRFIDDLRAPDYGTKPNAVRCAMYLDYLRMLKKARRQAVDARDALVSSLDGLRPDNKLASMQSRAAARRTDRAPGGSTLPDQASNSLAADRKARPEQSSAAGASDQASTSPLPDST